MADESPKAPVDPETVRLESLRPLPGSRRPRKRVGRGEGSGHGKTSGRGQKGQGARSGGGPRPGYQGGQMPLYMQQGKRRGANRKMSMPMGPHRTFTVPVNIGEIAKRFAEPGATVDVEALESVGLVKNNSNRRWPVKILAKGDLGHALTIRAHAFSAGARAKIEAAGGRAEVIGEEPPAPAPAQQQETGA